jgi:hypothetical protein
MATVNPIQIQKFLKGIDYPATKDDILRTAEKQGADDNVRQTIERLPNQKFNSPNDISEAVGKLD